MILINNKRKYQFADTNYIPHFFNNKNICDNIRHK